MIKFQVSAVACVKRMGVNRTKMLKQSPFQNTSNLYDVHKIYEMIPKTAPGGCANQYKIHLKHCRNKLPNKKTDPRKWAADLAGAIDAFDGSPLASMLGDTFSRSFVSLAREEVRLATEHNPAPDEVNDWERARYLEFS